MRLSTRLSAAVAVILIATIAACGGDSTGPPDHGVDTPGTLAQHLDTLYASAKATSAADTNYNFRVQLLSDLELASAFGAAPTTISVTTAAGTEQWKGFVFEEVMNDSGAASDSATFVVAYGDSLVHTAMITIFAANGVSLGSKLLANDTLVLTATSHTGSVTLTSTGSACPAPIAGLVNPIITSGDQASCLSAAFSGALTLGFPATTGVRSALTSFSFPTTTFAGERFFDPLPSASRVRLSARLLDMVREYH
jgi:hypothetical protein